MEVAGLLGKRTFMQMSPLYTSFSDSEFKVTGLHFSSWPSGILDFTTISNWFRFVLHSVLYFLFIRDSQSRATEFLNICEMEKCNWSISFPVL